jgi:hypothetical protein
MAVGGTIGAVAAAGCSATTAGICSAGAPAIVLGGMGLGAAAGGLAESLVANGEALLQAGLSWWDKKKLQIRIIIGTVLTEGELNQRQVETQKAKEEQVEDEKGRGEQKGEGDPPEPEGARDTAVIGSVGGSAGTRSFL